MMECEIVGQVVFGIALCCFCQ